MILFVDSGLNPVNLNIQLYIQQGALKNIDTTNLVHVYSYFPTLISPLYKLFI